jgi:hypothetical protein
MAVAALLLVSSDTTLDVSRTEMTRRCGCVCWRGVGRGTGGLARRAPAEGACQRHNSATWHIHACTHAPSQCS